MEKWMSLLYSMKEGMGLLDATVHKGGYITDKQGVGVIIHG